MKRSLLIGSVSLMGVVLCGWLGVAQTPKPAIEFTINSPVDQIFPYAADAATPQKPIEFTLKAIDSAGQPLENVPMQVSLQTPPRNVWYPTDFPVVEGTTLLELEAFAPNGVVQFQQMLPIRGDYSLNATIAPSQTTPIQETHTLSLPENGLKYRNFAILVVILLAAGLLGGWVIGGKQTLQPGEIAPQRVRLLLSGAMITAIAALLLLNLSTVWATSHSHDHAHSHDHGSSVNKPGNELVDTPSIQAAGLDVTLSGDSDAIVGQLAQFQVKVVDRQTRQPVTDVQLSLSATALEGGWIAFAYQGVPDAAGQLTWKQQFFDGAPHQLEVKVLPQPGSDRQFQPIRVSQTIDVEAVTPPLTTRLLGLAYFVGILVIGLLIGLKLHPPQSQQRYHSNV